MTPAFLLDTNIISHLMKTRPSPAHEHLRFHGIDAICTSPIVAIELRQGAEESSRPAHYHHLIDVILQSVRVHPFPDDFVVVAGRLRAHHIRKGQPLGEMDSLIADHALAAGLALVSNDRSFDPIDDLHREDWTKPRHES